MADLLLQQVDDKNQNGNDGNKNNNNNNKSSDLNHHSKRKRSQSLDNDLDITSSSKRQKLNNNDGSHDVKNDSNQLILWNNFGSIQEYQQLYQWVHGEFPKETFESLNHIIILTQSKYHTKPLIIHNGISEHDSADLIEITNS